jgi:hypothetical protein
MMASRSSSPSSDTRRTTNRYVRDISSTPLKSTTCSASAARPATSKKKWLWFA